MEDRIFFDKKNAVYYFNILDDAALHTNISLNSYASSAPMTSEKRFKKKLLKLVQIKELSNHVMNDK